MRVQVTLQNILDYSLDTLTGNTREDLLARAAESEASGFELFVKIPDVVGGDTEAPKERNVFKHHGSDLPEPDGSSHEQKSLNLAQQEYVDNPCYYGPNRHNNGDITWLCMKHGVTSKHSVDSESHAPCLTVDPYDT